VLQKNKENCHGWHMGMWESKVMRLNPSLKNFQEKMYKRGEGWQSIKGSEYDQRVVYASTEIPQWNPQVRLVFTNKDDIDMK
jgi:hypothetical protein